MADLVPRVLYVHVNDDETGVTLFKGTVQAAVAQQALSAALGAAEGAWVPPSAPPVSDGLYKALGGLPDAVQAITEAMLDSEAGSVLRIAIWRDWR